MKKEIHTLAISTPGRVCLFGEHQDYLGLPVIPCAISLRIQIEGVRRRDMVVSINLPNISSKESFSLDGQLPYVRERDYFRSAVNVLRRHDFSFSSGFDCVVEGSIPINSGTSSSSALTVTWINFLARMSDQAQVLSPELVARYAHEAEVLEFGEPGGMMDHYSTAFGGVIALEFSPSLKVERLEPKLGAFVLGDSGEPKDTKSILARVKGGVVRVCKQLANQQSEFSLHTTTVSDLECLRCELDSEDFKLLRGTLKNRDITSKAKTILQSIPLDHHEIGRLLNEHQVILRDVLRISTPKIDRMIDAALSAGAYGGKINGSGGGGCMFAYAPENPEQVAEAVKRAGGKVYIVHVDCGTGELNSQCA